MAQCPILKLLLARSEQAFDAMAARFGSRLLATAMNILGDREDAEETVSDTYLAVWNAVPPQTPDPVDPFVYRVGRNLALVDETGIRAASGTVVDLISMGLDEPVTMVLDRPFLFLLTVGDIPLFVGVVAEP